MSWPESWFKTWKEKQLKSSMAWPPGGIVTYSGDVRIDGVPGTAAPVPLEFTEFQLRCRHSERCTDE